MSVEELAIEDLATEIGADVREVRKALTANGFSIEEITTKNKYLVEMYISYLVAKDEAEEVRNSFRFQDGEEQVDKSRVYDNYRRHYLDLLADWQDAFERYSDSINELSNNSFHLRKRAEFLDANRRTRRIRRTFR